MPPKRATSKLGKGYAYASTEDEFDTLLGNSPAVVLPAVPIANSWNYGAQTTSALPTQTPVNPNISPVRIAKRIEAGIEIAQNRDSPSTQKGKFKKRSTLRQKKREPTPDQTQLQQDLDGVVSPTPSPPVRNTVSTDSSSDEEPPRQRRLSVMSNEPLYPSPLQRAGDRHQDDSGRSSADRESSVDNASDVSWDLERDIHEDDLQRTRPSKYRGGRNITKPPRRPSGLAITQDTIEEEEEPSSEVEAEDINGDELEEEAEPVSSAWTAPVRTIIPSIFRRSQSTEAIPEPKSPKSIQPPRESLSRKWLASIRPKIRDVQLPKPSRTNWIRAGLVLLLSLALASALQGGLLAALSGGTPGGLLRKIRSSISLGESQPMLPPNITETETFHGFTSQVSKMNSEMSSLSRELSSVRSEHANAPRPTDVSVPVIVGPRIPPKINFLSPAMGAMVDPSNTAPTADKNHPYFKRVWMRLFSIKPNFGRGPLPPVAALTPWDETGDCWCSVPAKGIVSQLSVVLGRDIVPEEVIVEYVPASTTLDPGTAPKEIEMWARFRIVPLDSEYDTQGSWWPWSSKKNFRSIEPRPAREEGLGGYNIPGEKSLHDVLMSSLRVSNAFEPESSYSDDPALGSNFYRVGRMEYDIHQENNIQRFSLNTIVDIPTIRVDKVVFRVKSNWGSNITCLYRIRLHGHL